jgi:hypothetical protein
MRIEARGISNFFSEMALIFDIPIGVEVAASDDLIDVYDIELKGEKLSDFLVKFVAQHGQYDWLVRDGVINIVPTKSHHDPVVDEILQTRINAFSIGAKTDCSVLANKLMETPEISRIMAGHHLEASGLNFSGPFFRTLDKISVRRSNRAR